MKEERNTQEDRRIQESKKESRHGSYKGDNQNPAPRRFKCLGLMWAGPTERKGPRKGTHNNTHTHTHAHHSKTTVANHKSTGYRSNVASSRPPFSLLLIMVIRRGKKSCRSKSEVWSRRSCP